MIQVPMSFRGRMVPMSSEQWSTLYTILSLEIRANPLALEGPRNRTTRTRANNGLTWDDWFRDFIHRQDVHNVLSSGDTAAMWFSEIGRQTIAECMRYQAGVIAMYERRRLRKAQSLNSADGGLSNGGPAESGEGRDVVYQQGVVWDLDQDDGTWAPARS
ncbi:hypothetical protein HOY80DRAFT_1035694 [Tuber brumale]|nr:hypothetical protein HOY80DRAFT_1035694 [Tuber brumale]